MTIEELENTLPNGLHDSELRRLEVDYVRLELRIVLSILVGCPGDADPEAMREGTLTVTGLRFLVIDPPMEMPLDAQAAGFSISAGPGQPSTAPIELPVLPANSFLHWLFVKDWNSFIRIAGTEARFAWADVTGA